MGLCCLANAAPPSLHVCLKVNEVNWRTGPGYDHPIRWIFKNCASWPVIVRRKCWQWYYVEDSEGYMGWIHAHLLAFKRMVFIMQDKVSLRKYPQPQAPVLAYLKKGVLGRYHRCVDGWNYISVAPYKGWVLQEACWNPK